MKKSMEIPTQNQLELKIRLQEKKVSEISARIKEFSNGNLSLSQSQLCQICKNSFKSFPNDFASCSKCGLVVHKYCYGIEPHFSEPWNCAVCCVESDPTTVICELCSVQGGVFTLVSNTLEPEAQFKFVHTICASFIPEVSYGISKCGIMTRDISSINIERSKLKCGLCKSKSHGWPSVQCVFGRCTRATHPYCVYSSPTNHFSYHHSTEKGWFVTCQEHEDRVLDTSKAVTTTTTNNKKKKEKHQTSEPVSSMEQGSTISKSTKTSSRSSSRRSSSVPEPEKKEETQEESVGARRRTMTIPQSSESLEPPPSSPISPPLPSFSLTSLSSSSSSLPSSSPDSSSRKRKSNPNPSTTSKSNPPKEVGGSSPLVDLPSQDLFAAWTYLSNPDKAQNPGPLESLISSLGLSQAEELRYLRREEISALVQLLKPIPRRVLQKSLGIEEDQFN